MERVNSGEIRSSDDSDTFSSLKDAEENDEDAGPNDKDVEEQVSKNEINETRSDSESASGRGIYCPGSGIPASPIF